jgi:uncharacterized membrane protein YhhN
VQGGGTWARYFVAPKSPPPDLRLPRQSWIIHPTALSSYNRAAMRTLSIRISLTLALFYLLAISIEGLSIVFSLDRTAIDVFVIFKVGSIAALIVFAARAAQRRIPLLVSALILSAIGDFLLAPKQLGPLNESQLFLCGLLAFLVAHIFYIALFLKNVARRKLPQVRRFSIVLVIAVLWFLLSRLWPSLGNMRLPVLIYATALSSMAISAQFSRFPATVSVGALSFLASDAMLAVSHFSRPFPFSRPLIWATYYSAQSLICLGVVAAIRSTAPKIPAPLLRPNLP